MDYVGGRSFWDQRLPGLDAAEKRAIYGAMVTTLAALHRVDPDAVGLADLGRPDGYVPRQIDRWTRQYRASQRARVAAMGDEIGSASCRERVGQYGMIPGGAAQLKKKKKQKKN